MFYINPRERALRTARGSCMFTALNSHQDESYTLSIVGSPAKACLFLFRVLYFFLVRFVFQTIKFLYNERNANNPIN